MSCDLRPMRYAHFEGHTDMSYTKDGKYIVTSGADGEVRVFEGLDDDNCITHVIADSISAIGCTESNFLVGLDNNTVQLYTLESGAVDGLITRFTAPATHIAVSKDNNTIAIGSSDMTIKVHDVALSNDKLFTGHKAPILSVALDPKGEYLASSGCDGCVKVWNIEHSLEVKSFSILPKCNSFNASDTLARLSWSKDGQSLFVPVEKEIKIFDRSDWQEKGSFTSQSITQTISICSVSPAGDIIAGVCRDGLFIFWDVASGLELCQVTHAKKKKVTALMWNPADNQELAFVDIDGQFGVIWKISKSSDGVNNDGSTSDIFPPLGIDDPMNGDLNSLKDDDEDDEFSIAKIKSNLGFADDEEGTFLGLPDTTTNDASETKNEEVSSVITAPAAPVFKLPEPQKPFQPGMSPEHLDSRYMTWNSVGIVRQYTNEENSIEVEFHDASTHHSLHQNNPFNHTMATLSNQVLALACEAQDDQPSKLQVHLLNAWDGSKEWFIDMPEGEEVMAICAGNGWVAAATDRRNLRIFSNSGIQRDILSISGPIVCLAGYEDLIFIVYHSGMGVSGEQRVSAKVFNINGLRHPMPVSTEVDLSPNSFLSWAGFTDEGTPAAMDSAGIVRIINPKYGYNWIPILNSKLHAKGKSDNYFMLGISERLSNIRCIMCKGSRYPPILPRPHMSVLDIKIPLCEMDNAKSEFEEQILNRTLLSGTLDKLSENGFDVDEAKEENQKLLTEKMIKFFALCCQSDKELRAFELAQLMPSQRLAQTAIKYAAKVRKIQLAERLGEVVQQKAEEEAEKQLKEQKLNQMEEFGYFGCNAKPPRNEYESDEEETIDESQKSSQSSVTLKPSQNPLLEARKRKESELKMRPNMNTQSDRNPFKKSAKTSSDKRGIDLIDTYSNPKSKSEESNKQPFKPINKKLTKTSSISSPQEKLNNGKENTNSNSIHTQSPKSKKSALQLWFEDNENVVKECFPDTPSGILLSKAALVFKDVEDSIKQKYKTLALSQTNETPSGGDDKKRKLDNTDSQDTQSNPIEKKSKISGMSKLAAFAFNKEE